MTTVLTSLSPVPLEVTYDQVGLNVALLVLKWDGSAWVQDGPLIPAVDLLAINSYGVLWTPPRVGQYICEIAVYTDNTYATRQDGYYASSRSFSVDLTLSNELSNLNAILNSIESLVVAAVNPTPSVIGVVAAETELTGVVENEGDIQ